MRKKHQKPLRKRNLFWLNVNNPEESKIAFYIEDLKKAGKFTAAIRDGLRLIQDLRSGHTDVLVELFPDVVAAFTPVHLQSEFDRLAQLIAEIPNAAPASNLKASYGGGNLSMPTKITLDDFGLDLTIGVEKTGGNSAENFINGMLDFIS